MFGWFTDSLSYRVRKAEREWRAANPIGREDAYGPLQRRLVEMSGRPLRWALSYLMVLAVLSGGVWLWYENKYPGWANLANFGQRLSSKSGHRLSASLAYLTVPWTIQATLAGLVYPIVISFVTILLQRRYNAKAILGIYLADSAAIPSGLSALALVGVIGVQYLLFPLAPSAVIPLWVVLDGVVFLCNLWLTASFLYRTFEFVRPDKRARIIRQYAANVAWPQELREHHAQNIFSNFIDGPRTNSSVVITTNKAALLYRGDIADVSTRVQKLSRISDIRLRLLHWALFDWWTRAVNHLREGNAAKNRANSSDSLAARPVLVMPPLLGQPVDGGLVVLCQTDGLCPCSDRAQWLIRHAFIFKPIQKTPSYLRISDILGDVQAEAVLAIQANETQTFTDRLREWVNLYCHLISEAPFRNFPAAGDNQSDRVIDFGSNPVQLFWKSRISVTAARSAEELADAAVAKLDTNTEFVLATMRILGELHRRLRESLHPGAFLDYFALLPIVFARVQVWWVTTAEQNGDVEHTPCHSVLLRPPFLGTYRLILRTFTEEWRRWEKAIIPALAKDNSARQCVQPWSVLQNGAEYLHTHMRKTLMLFFGCVQRGDKQGAQRLLDILLTWRAQIEPQDIRSIADGLPRRNWLTLEVVACAWEEAKNNWAAQWDPGWRRPDAEGSWESRMPEAVFWAALRNYWVDACYIAMVGLVTIGRDCLCETSLVADLLKALVLGEMPGADDNSQYERPPHDSRAWLFVLLRFYEAYPSPGNPRRPQYSYRFRLRGVWNEIVAWNDDAREGGRTDSRLPVFTDEMRKDALLVIWLLLAEPVPTALPSDARRFEEWVSEDPYRAEVFVKELSGMRARLERAEFKAKYQGLTEGVGSLVVGGGFDERVTERSKGLGEIVDSLGAITRSVVARTPINEGRVQETGRSYSESDIFTSCSSHFAVKLFRSAGAVTNEEVGGVLYRSWVVHMSRAAFIESPTGNPDAHDNRDLMKLRFGMEVAATIVTIAIEQMNPKEADAGSAQEWWAQVRAFAEECKKSGLQPLCVLAGQTPPPWLLGWAHQGGSDNTGKPGDLRLWRDQEWSQIDGYVGNLGDVPAFHCLAQADQSYLLVRESLDRVTFVRWEDGYFVRASVNGDQNDDVCVVLKLAWRAKVEVKAGPVLRLNYAW